MEAHAARKYGDDLRIGSHSGREEYNGDEHEQRTEHIHEIRYEIHVIIQYDSFERSLLRHEVVNLLTDVEDDHDSDYEQNRDKERGHELLYYVSVQFGGKHFLLN